MRVNISESEWYPVLSIRKLRGDEKSGPYTVEVSSEEMKEIEAIFRNFEEGQEKIKAIIKKNNINL